MVIYLMEICNYHFLEYVAAFTISDGKLTESLTSLYSSTRLTAGIGLLHDGADIIEPFECHHGQCSFSKRAYRCRDLIGLLGDVVRNPGRVSSATDIGVPAVWRIGSVV